MAKSKFQYLEAVVFDVSYCRGDYSRHPLKNGQLVIYLGEIPNVPGHCVVATYEGHVVPMIHPDELRQAEEDEL